jgi:hypothetical protein
MQNNKQTAKERNSNLTKTQEVTYAQELKSTAASTNNPGFSSTDKEQTNEDNS